MKNVNPWKLAAVFGTLILIFAALKVFRSPGLQSNMPGNLVEFDSAQITDLIIIPAKKRDEIRLTRAGNWRLIQNNQTLRLEQGAGVNALRMLTVLKPERIMSRKKEKWDEFGVGDSTGTRVRVMNGTSTEADIMVGRSAYNQMAGQRYGGTSYTFVRLTGESEVYAVEGFLDAQFNRGLDDWRDKSLLRIKKDSVFRISFQYPADSGFVVEKVGSMWIASSQQADSAKVKSYLGGLEYKNGTLFASSIAPGSPTATITFHTRKGIAATLDGWFTPAGTWILRSSLQPESAFVFDQAAMRDMFRGSRSFVSGTK